MKTYEYEGKLVLNQELARHATEFARSQGHNTKAMRILECAPDETRKRGTKLEEFTFGCEGEPISKLVIGTRNGLIEARWTHEGELECVIHGSFRAGKLKWAGVIFPASSNP